MNTSADLRFLRDSLTQWAKERQGTVRIAANLGDLFAVLSTRPGGLPSYYIPSCSGTYFLHFSDEISPAPIGPCNRNGDPFGAI